MENTITNNWKYFLEEELNKEYFKELKKNINKEYEKKIIFPQKEDIFTAYKITDFNDIKVVILGQDPYHNVNQAHGLSFSVNEQIKVPPSLKNIYKEIKNNYESFNVEKNGYLLDWAEQGVFLLNTVLTVEKNKPNSHKNLGWEIFTTNTIKEINSKLENVVFLLWGANAISKKDLIDNEKHLVLTAPHPSPFSAYKGFFGCNHFLKANKYLSENNKNEIRW